MEVNSRFISIPPLLSVSWQQVACLYQEEELLIVVLVNGTSVELSNLPTEMIEKLFAAHLAYMRRTTNTLLRLPTLSKEAQGNHSFIAPTSLEEPAPLVPSEQIANVRLSFSPMDGIGSALQHDPAMASAPNIPTDILMKFAAIAKILAPEEIDSLPKAEASCNCMHCQIVKAIQVELTKAGTPALDEPKTANCEEEIISENELQFQQWEIKPTGNGDKLFSVINKIEPKEQYRVFLGDPIGCTCGTDGCEHVIAVLKMPVN